MKQSFGMEEYICSMKGHLRDALLRFRAGVSWIPRIEHGSESSGMLITRLAHVRGIEHRDEGSGMLGSRLEHVLAIEHGSEACEVLLRSFELVFPGQSMEMKALECYLGAWNMSPE